MATATPKTTASTVAADAKKEVRKPIKIEGDKFKIVSRMVDEAKRLMEEEKQLNERKKASHKAFWETLHEMFPEMGESDQWEFVDDFMATGVAFLQPEEETCDGCGGTHPNFGELLARLTGNRG